jgi:hypothetical protein
MVREAKRSYMKRYLNPNLPPKNLWRNLDEIGAKETSDNNIIFIPDQINTFFAATRPAATPKRAKQNYHSISPTISRFSMQSTI